MKNLIKRIILETANDEPYDIVNDIIKYENGDMNDREMVIFFAKIIKSGVAWQLQGSIYGKAARHFIELGIIDKMGNINWNEYQIATGGQEN